MVKTQSEQIYQLLQKGIPTKNVRKQFPKKYYPHNRDTELASTINIMLLIHALKQAIIKDPQQEPQKAFWSLEIDSGNEVHTSVLTNKFHFCMFV